MEGLLPKTNGQEGGLTCPVSVGSLMSCLCSSEDFDGPAFGTEGDLGGAAAEAEFVCAGFGAVSASSNIEMSVDMVNKTGQHASKAPQWGFVSGGFSAMPSSGSKCCHKRLVNQGHEYPSKEEPQVLQATH